MNRYQNRWWPVRNVSACLSTAWHNHNNPVPTGVPIAVPTVAAITAPNKTLPSTCSLIDFIITLLQNCQLQDQRYRLSRLAHIPLRAMSKYNLLGE